MSRRVKFLINFVVVVLTSVVFSQLQAEEKKSREIPEYELGEIVVTATRTQAYTGELGSWATVITRDELKQKGEDRVLEVLEDLEGLTVVQNGPFGGATSAFLRGAKSGHTLVMIDGVEVNDPMSTDRNFDLAHLTTDNIERIEVIRGPQSALYGSDAIGGVINIITRKGKGSPKASLSLESGSYNTFRGSMNISGSTKEKNYSFNISHTNSGGISKAIGGSKDGYQNNTISSRLGFDIFGESKLNLALRYTDSVTDIDKGSFSDDPNYTSKRKNLSSKVELVQPITSWWEHKLSFSILDTKRDYHNKPDTQDPSEAISHFEGKTKRLAWQTNFSAGKGHTITGGFEYNQEIGSSYSLRMKADTVFSRDEFPKREVIQKGCYLQDQLHLWNKLFTRVGIRVEDHQLFGTDTNYSLSFAYRIPDTGMKLKANWGTGFKAPSLYQLYSEYGSPKLRPDESESYDFGIQQYLLEGKASFSLAYFNNEFDNMVDWDSKTFSYKNIGEAKTKGIEAKFSIKPLEDLTLNFNYTYMDAKNERTRERLLRRPWNRCNLNLLWHPVKGSNLNLEVVYKGNRQDMDYTSWPAKRIFLEDYVKVDLFYSYKLLGDYQVFAKVKNLFNEEYQKSYGFATPGRSFYGGIQTEF